MAQTALAGKESFVKTHAHVLNPKSVTMEQLYGAVDPGTGEWNDGIAAKIIGNSAKDDTDDKHWVMFDGPVDALWIESMNTVLDDNKKLCLNSGQIIPLSPHMTMMFEVADLAVASPATVSRCGMVYMEPDHIGIPPLVQSWLSVQAPSFYLRPKHTVPLLQRLFDKYMEPCLHFMRRNCSEMVQTPNNNLVASLLRILDCFFKPYWDTDAKKVTAEEIEELEGMLEPLFVYSVIWSIGCTTDPEGREKFAGKIKELLGKDNEHKFPSGGSVYDYCYNKEIKEWVVWTETVDPYSIQGNPGFNEITVPTFDSIRMKYITKLLVVNRKHVLSPGPTGTGKTVNIGDLLNQELTEDFQCIPISFSAQTGAN